MYIGSGKSKWKYFGEHFWMAFPVLLVIPCIVLSLVVTNFSILKIYFGILISVIGFVAFLFAKISGFKRVGSFIYFPKMVKKEKLFYILGYVMMLLGICAQFYVLKTIA